MPSLNESMRLIDEIAESKGGGEEIERKLWYGAIELAEGGDAWKHRGDPEYLMNELGITPEQVPRHVAEELIDCIFYCLHAYHCLNLDVSPDEMFLMKLEKNWGRNRVYVDDMKTLSMLTHEKLPMKDYQQ